MATPVVIRGSSEEQAAVLDGALVVSDLPVPASINKILSLPYSRFLTIGDDGVTEDLRVVGSLANPQLAFVSAEAGADIYIKEIKIVIADSIGGNGINLSGFGAIPGGVDNGFIPYFEDKGQRLQVNDRPLFSNLDFVRLGKDTPSLGSDETAFRVKGAKTSNDYAYLPSWDLTTMSAGSNGVRLIAGSKQSFGIEIRDDITSLLGFEILAIGFRRFV